MLSLGEIFEIKIKDMKTNGNESVIPQTEQEHVDGDILTITTGGLTKREYFTAMAMQGILSAQVATVYLETNAVAIRARRQADALIKELNAEESK